RPGGPLARWRPLAPTAPACLPGDGARGGPLRLAGQDLAARTAALCRRGRAPARLAGTRRRFQPQAPDPRAESRLTGGGKARFAVRMLEASSIREPGCSGPHDRSARRPSPRSPGRLLQDLGSAAPDLPGPALLVEPLLLQPPVHDLGHLRDVGVCLRVMGVPGDAGFRQHQVRDIAAVLVGDLREQPVLLEPDAPRLRRGCAVLRVEFLRDVIAPDQQDRMPGELEEFLERDLGPRGDLLAIGPRYRWRQFSFREDRISAWFPADLAGNLVCQPGRQQAARMARRMGMKNGSCAMLLVDLLEQHGEGPAFALDVMRLVELDILVAEILIQFLGILRERHAGEELLLRCRRILRPRPHTIGEDEPGREGLVDGIPRVFVAGLAGP